mmetsp:Transcript_73987/g.211275  ORF Transcript_73987/g.211275 Transcript_73987/m.211275 type:complete len:248 (-) Transcript_73987:6-749(-)
MSAPCSRSRSSIQTESALMSTSPATSIPKLETDSSCSCSASVLRNSGSISSVRFRLKAFKFNTFSAETLDCVVRMIGAKAFIVRSRVSTLLRSSSLGTKSILLRMRRSANATCSTLSFSAPSGFSSSRCCSMWFASTSVTMPSSLKNSCTKSSTKKVCATGAGSAMPVVSITIASSLSPCCCLSASFLRVLMRSSRTVQQTQPFSISITSSSVCSFMFLRNNESSMPTSPNSFSMPAMRQPCFAVRI